MKRVLGLYLPFLATDRLRRRDSGQVEGVPGVSPAAVCRAPVATVAVQGSVIRVVHGDRAAYEAGVQPGQTLAETKAIASDLVTYEDDPAADRRQLEALAIWANSLSPIVHLEGDDTLLVDITGSERLFGGEHRLLRQAIDGLSVLGFGARGGIADTPGAAWALAHAHPEPEIIVDPGQGVAPLAALPVWSLRVDAKTTASLSSVGVETVEALLHLPRSSLRSRFGDHLLHRMDQALGDVPEVLTPYRLEPVLTSRFAFGTATTRIDIFQAAIRQALERFCEKLARQVVGVRQMFVTFYCPDREAGISATPRPVSLEVNLSKPTRSVAHLDSLLTVLVGDLALPAPADSLVLWARHLDPLSDWQDELFVTESRDAQALGDLLDRLAIRLGAEAVVRPEPLSDHLPERAFRYVSVVGEQRGTSTPRGTSAPRGGSTRRAADFSPRGDSDADTHVTASTAGAPSFAIDQTHPTSNRPSSIASSRQTGIPGEGWGTANAECRMQNGEQRNRPPPNPAVDPHDLAAPHGAGMDGAPADGDPRGLKPGDDSTEESPRGLKPAARFGVGCTTHRFARPLRMLPHPLRIAVTALAVEGTPISFRWHGRQHTVVASVGPERIETGWWRGAHVQRDYYRVTADTGRRCWLFRDRACGTWFLHGWFD